MTITDAPATPALTAERADLLEALRKHRGLFRHTVADLSDDLAASRPTVSELCLGGLVKHVAAVESQWCDFITDGPAELSYDGWDDIDWSDPPAEVVAYQNGFRMLEGETLAGLLAAYDEVAEATDVLLEHVDLDARQPLPSAPWNEPGATWSARRVFVHIIAETAQHAGHADILRETIDGRKSMG